MANEDSSKPASDRGHESYADDAKAQRVNFTTFMEYYEKQELGSKDSRRLHYLEEPEQFTLYIKSNDLWEYFTIIKKKTIMEFHKNDSDSINMFKTNILHNAMKLKPKEVQVTQLTDADPVTKENKETIEDESVKYDTFLIREFNKFEKQILASFDRNMPVEKSVTAFLSDIFSVVKTVGWYKSLKRVISFTFKQGVEEAEKETKVDIGVGIDFDKKVDIEAYRQMNGFPLPGGESWPGIKGVSQELEDDIMKGVSDSMIKGESSKETRDRIKKVFDGYTGSEVDGEVTEGRIDRIARTETNRMYSSEKLESYKKSGVPGRKEWNTFIDNRTGDIDKRMDGQTVGLDEPFTDPNTGTQFMHPPAHPNCRCVINFVLDEN